LQIYETPLAGCFFHWLAAVQGVKNRPREEPRKTPWKNEPPQLRNDLYRAFGVDLTQVFGDQRAEA